MENRPTAAELVDAVARWLADEVQPALSGAAAFHARVAGNALRIVERELRAGSEWFDPDRVALRGLLGGEDPVDDGSLRHALARGIRGGAYDDRLDEVVAALLPLARRKLAIDNPKHLSPEHRAEVSVP